MYGIFTYIWLKSMVNPLTRGNLLAASGCFPRCLNVCEDARNTMAAGMELLQQVLQSKEELAG